MNGVYYSCLETIDKISDMIDSDTPGGYFRFGDGDMNLALGLSEMLQQSNPQLQVYMSDALKEKDKNILKGLTLHNKEWDTLEEGMFGGNHMNSVEWCEELYNKFKIFVDDDYTEIYSSVALSHLATQDPVYTANFLKKIKPKVKYLIGNQNIPDDIVKSLFGDVTFIRTPSQNSFTQFEEIYGEFVKSAKDDKDYSIIVTSMGCSGRAMQKRIWDNYNNVFLFDFGSLMDALCGDQTRAWIELTNFDKSTILDLL